jgi:acetylornithine deacetylase
VSSGWLDEAVAAQRPWMEDLLVRLVEAPTVLGAEEAGQALMAQAFADCGLEPVDVPLDPDALRADPGHSPFSWDVAGKRNVVASWAGTGGDGARSLVLNGHVDVVPPASEALWTSPPFRARRERDWLFGRGAGDMKAGLVAMTGAVKAEPHPDHATVAQVGVLWFHVDVRGVPAHAARASTLGTDAFTAAQGVLAELRALEAELNAERGEHPHYAGFAHPINLNPGVVSAGDWASTVRAECTLSCRLALYPGQRPAELRARVEAAVTRAAARDPFLAEHPPAVRYDGFSCEGSVVEGDAPIVLAVADAFRDVHGGAELERRATTATTDARHFVRHGIPAICFGPRAEDIHGIDERVSMSSLADVASVLARVVLQWCGGAPDHPAPTPDHRRRRSIHVSR